jgi:hypothetical protein
MKVVRLFILLVEMLIPLPAFALTAQVVPTQPSFILGEPIRFEVQVTNDSLHSISLRGNNSPEDDMNMGPGISIEFHALPPGVIYGAAQVRIEDETPVDIHLLPGKTYRETGYLRFEFIRVLRPGAYKLVLDVWVMGNRIHPFNPYLRVPANLAFTVLPPDAHALMAKMKDLRRRILGGGASERDQAMLMLLQFSDPTSIRVAGEVYSRTTPQGEKEMIDLSQLNFDIGRKYLEEFKSKTPPGHSDVRVYLNDEIDNFDRAAKFEAAFIKAAHK